MNMVKGCIMVWPARSNFTRKIELIFGIFFFYLRSSSFICRVMWIYRCQWALGNVCVCVWCGMNESMSSTSLVRRTHIWPEVWYVCVVSLASTISNTQQSAALVEKAKKKKIFIHSWHPFHPRIMMVMMIMIMWRCNHGTDGRSENARDHWKHGQQVVKNRAAASRPMAIMCSCVLQTGLRTSAYGIEYKAYCSFGLT